MKSNNTRRGKTQADKDVIVKNKVILNLIQDLQRLPLLLVNNMRGRFQIKFGMTPLFNNGGFTLIELLVVVLIIGILAAVALPQYQRAVTKSRVAGYWPVLQTIAQVGRACDLQKGTHCTLDELDIDVPLCQPLPGETTCEFTRAIFSGWLNVDSAVLLSNDYLYLGIDERGRFCTHWGGKCAKYGMNGPSEYMSGGIFRYYFDE